MPSRRPHRLLLSAAILLAFAFAAELLVRVRAYVKYGAHLEVYDLFERHPEAGVLMAIPNLSTEFARKYRIDIDSNGFRNPETQEPKAANTIRFAFLGGSTTFCGQASSNEATWPHRLVERVADAYPEGSFDYLNAGVTGYSVGDSRKSLHWRLRPRNPDVIVIYHAAKDLADDSRVPALAQGLVEETGEPSFLERHSLLWMLVKKNLRYRARQQQGRNDSKKLSVDMDQLSEGFAQRLTELVHQAQEIADLVVLPAFSIMVRNGQSEQEQLDALAQAFTFTPYLTPEGVIQGYQSYNRRIRQVAEETGALYVGEEHSVPGTAEYFHDSVHFTERGYEAMANRVADVLCTAPRFADLVTSRRVARQRQ